MRVKLLKPVMVGRAFEPVDAVVDIEDNRAIYLTQTGEAKLVPQSTSLTPPSASYTKKRKENETAESLRDLGKIIADAVAGKPPTTQGPEENVPAPKSIEKPSEAVPLDPAKIAAMKAEEEKVQVAAKPAPEVTKESIKK